MPRKPSSLASRFWPKVDVRGEAECWPWLAGTIGKGYGRIGRGRAKDGAMGAHVAAWELTYGPVPKGLCVLHHCDNPPCCNPSHLFIGTHSDNSRDAVAKGRWRIYNPRGETNPNAKLTWKDVEEMRRRYRTGESTQRALAREFGISTTHLCGIIKGRHWKTERNDPA